MAQFNTISCDTLISPRADKAIRNRAIGCKKRAVPVNFRNILRQRCRERVKARRGALFDDLRSLNNEESMRNALSLYIENDLKELQATCALNEVGENEYMDASEKEPLALLAVSDTEKWILGEYDRLLENINAQVELASIVVCPLCEKGELEADEWSEVVTCSLCSLLLPLKVSLTEFETLIFQAINCHEQFCSEKPQFTLCPDSFSTNFLLLLCGSCSHVQQII